MGGKLFAGCKLIGDPAPNQCQIITFLTLKTDHIAELKIELKSILVLTVSHSHCWKICVDYWGAKRYVE